MTLFHMGLSALAGYGGHQSYRVTRRFDNGWSQIVCYTLGTLFCLPFVVAIHQDLEEIRNPVKRLVIAYLLAYGSFGIGTVLGWYHFPFDGPMMAEPDV
jgi:hypothetical protein